MCYDRGMNQAAVFCLIFASFMLIANAVKGSDIPKANSGIPAIKESREYILNKERTKAAERLLRAIEFEKPDLSSRELILQELSRVSSLFLTNDGQKNFELAESIRLSGQTGYQAKYDEALLTEDNNLQILIGQALGLIAAKNCKEARTAIDRGEKVNPYSEEIKILKMKTSLCVGGVEIPTEQISAIEAVTRSRAIALSILAQYYFQEKKYDLALIKAREAMNAETTLPTGYYYAWKVLSQNLNEGLDEAQSFLNLCKSINSKMRKKFYLDPLLCEGEDTVQEFIKKIETGAQ